jgi:hypothetical protein
MKKLIKQELGFFLNKYTSTSEYPSDWRRMNNFWATLEQVVFPRNRPPTKSERMRFQSVRMELIREFLDPEQYGE